MEEEKDRPLARRPHTSAAIRSLLHGHFDDAQTLSAPPRIRTKPALKRDEKGLPAWPLALQRLQPCSIRSFCSHRETYSSYHRGKMQLHVLSWPGYYYLATIGFALIDWFAGANVRAVGFEAHPGLKTVYYVVATLCGVLLRAFPAWSAPVTLAESTVNVSALMISVLSPLYTFDVEQGIGPSNGLVPLVMNFLIAGTAGTLAFYQSLSALSAPRP